jgi:hypothetical protein
VLDDQTRDGAQQEEEKHALAIRALTKRKRLLETEETIRQKPALDLMTETKLFREEVFKGRNMAKNGASD